MPIQEINPLHDSEPLSIPPTLAHQLIAKLATVWKVDPQQRILPILDAQTVALALDELLAERSMILLARDRSLLIAQTVEAVKHYRDLYQNLLQYGKNQE
jgi:hypothetical protein